MGSLLSFVTALTTFITGPFGLGLIAVAVAGSFLAAMFNMAPRLLGFVALLLGAAAMSGSWAVNTFIGAGGGGP